MATKKNKKARFKPIVDRMRDYYEKKVCKPPKEKFEEETLKNIPRYAGVYIVYHKNNPIYVGRSNTIWGRICNQHLSKKGSKKNPYSSSSFKKKLLKHLKIELTEQNQWILNNCKFKFIKVDTYDDQLLLEALLIAMWRKKGSLLNDNKDKAAPAARYLEEARNLLAKRKINEKVALKKLREIEEKIYG